MSHRAKYRGFTLIEMLLALTLTAVLLTIVSVTIGAVLRDNQRLETMRAEPLWLDSVVHVIRRDLQQAESYRETAGVLILQSHAGIPEVEDVQNHDPVQIEYELVSHDDTRWLIRRVIPMQASHSKQSKIELLCGGIESLHLVARDVTDRQNTGQERVQRDPTDEEQEMESIPDQLMLTLTYRGLVSNDPKPIRHSKQKPLVQTSEYLITLR